MNITNLPNRFNKNFNKKDNVNRLDLKDVDPKELSKIKNNGVSQSFNDNFNSTLMVYEMEVKKQLWQKYTINYDLEKTFNPELNDLIINNYNKSESIEHTIELIKSKFKELR